MKIGPLQLSLRRLVTFVGIGVVLVLVMNFNTRLEELTRLQNEVSIVRTQGTAIVVTQQALKTQVALATSSSAVDGYAREQAHMAQPGDKVIIVMPVAGATLLPTPQPTPVYTNLTKWDVWMALIFGK